jgi:hypothetical protein
MNFRSIALLIVSVAGFAQTKTVGPAVGSRFPQFSLPDQNGKMQTFDSIKGPKGAVLVFYRSADW